MQCTVRAAAAERTKPALRHLAGQSHVIRKWEGEAPAEPRGSQESRLGGSLALPEAAHAIAASPDIGSQKKRSPWGPLECLAIVWGRSVSVGAPLVDAFATIAIFVFHVALFAIIPAAAVAPAVVAVAAIVRASRCRASALSCSLPIRPPPIAPTAAPISGAFAGAAVGVIADDGADARAGSSADQSRRCPHGSRTRCRSRLLRPPGQRPQVLV